jgi:hypothetical protein
MSISEAIAMVTIRFILIMALMAAVPTANAIGGSGASGLLRDDYVISGADGRLVEGEGGKWLFEFESGVSDGAGEVKAGQMLELLKSGTLDKMAADAKERSEARYRLWGKVTKFEGKNYVFAAYFVGLRKIDGPAAEPGKTTDEGARQTVNAPNDVLDIPDEIVAKLQTSEVLPTVESPAGLQLKQDTIFANRAGRMLEREGKYLFEPDGLGRGVENFTIELLPCQALEDATVQMRGEPDPLRFSVAGIFTRYKDQQYLLLQKATRVYSYGNFGR